MAQLFDPLKLRDIVLSNRIGIPSMCPVFGARRHGRGLAFRALQQPRCRRRGVHEYRGDCRGP